MSLFAHHTVRPLHLGWTIISYRSRFGHDHQGLHMDTMQICSSLQGTRTSFFRSAVDVKRRSAPVACHKVWRLRPGTMMRLGWQRRSLGCPTELWRLWQCSNMFQPSTGDGDGHPSVISRLITMNPIEEPTPLQQCQRLRITTLSNFKSQQNYLMWADSIHSYDAWGMILTWNTFCVSDLFG